MRAATVDPESRSALAALRGHGLALAVLTNNVRASTLATLEHFALHDLFELVLTRDEVAMKPDPAGVHHALAHVGADKERAVVVGDSWLDGTAAAQAGVAFIGFRTDSAVLERRGIQPWTVVESLVEIAPYLAQSWSIA
jgi:phosphoglycolate phosphatase